MATKPRKRTPLLIILVGVLLGFIGTTLLFGGASQATTPSVGVCEGKGCVECDSSTQKCLPPPAPTPEPPAPSVTPEPPAPTPEPPAPSVTPEPPAPTPECTGKGCVECDSSTQKCLPPPAPTPEPPAPSVTPEPPAPSVTPEPPASTPDLTPTPSPEPGPVASVLAKTGISASSLPWVAVILAAAGWELCNKAQQKRRA